MSHTIFRLRRVLPLTSTILSHSHFHLRRTATLNSLTSLNPKRASSTPTQTLRQFHSTQLLLSSHSFDDTEKIDPDTILFPGCDYNHWLIVMDFGKDPAQRPSPAQMVDTYVNTAAKIFGSVEEAKKRIYACSTTTYTGFQVLVDQETSKKFEELPGVTFVLPDSYIDPVNKEYGGDKYINGEIIPRPPPVQYVRPKRGDRQNSQGPRSPRQYQQASPPYNQQAGPAYNQHGSVRGDVAYMPQEPQRQNHHLQQNYPPQQTFGPPGQGDLRNSMPTGGQYPPGGRGHYQDGQNHSIPRHQGSFNDGRNYPQGQMSNNLRAGGDYVPQGQFSTPSGDQGYNSQGQMGNSQGHYPPQQQIGYSPGGRDGYLQHGQIGNSPGGTGGYAPQGHMSSIPGGPGGYPPRGQMGFSGDNTNYNSSSAASVPYEQSGAAQYAQGGGTRYAPAVHGENPLQKIDNIRLVDKLE